MNRSSLIILLVSSFFLTSATPLIAQCSDGSQSTGDGTFVGPFINEGTTLMQGQTIFVGSDIVVPATLSIQSVSVKYLTFNPDFSPRYTGATTFLPPNADGDGFFGFHTIDADAEISMPGVNISILQFVVFFEDAGGTFVECRFFNFFITLEVAAPVQFADFTGRPDGRANLLRWRTAAESQNAYFQVERSIDGQQFQALGRVTGAGNSNVERAYSFLDQNPLINAFYRVRQVDFDGSYDYSELIFLARPQDSEVFIFPTKTQTILNIRLDDQWPFTHAHIYDLAGRQLFTQEWTNADANIFSIDVSHLQAGNYFISLQGPELSSTQPFQKY
ncbi:MAG: T9SS type A sorting domain-containing protein [Bacteroidota bacterium]